MIRIRTGLLELFRRKIEYSKERKDFVSQYDAKSINDESCKDSILYIATSNEQIEYLLKLDQIIGIIH